MTFPERLNQILEERGISQRWVADVTGVTEASVSRWITENSYPKILDNILSLSKALNVSADYLIGLTDIPTRSADFSPDAALLLRCYSRINEEDKLVLWALLDRYIAPIDKQKNPVFGS